MTKEIVSKDWNSLEETPPDELVEVIDLNGNISKAIPTYYPFKVVPNPNKVGKWTSDVVPCDSYWDGGWMIQCDNLISEINGIIGWRKIKKYEKNN